MRTRFGFFVALAALQALSVAPALAADCSQGSADEQIACLNRTVTDMRIYPRCLENPGPNTPNITDVFANSCAKIPAQTWMISKPYK